MNASGAQLLRQLASGIRPDSATSSPARIQLDGATFSDLLARVRRGEVTSGIPLTIDPRADVSLSTPQLERLSIVADAAEAAGLNSVVAGIDGIAVRIDVQDRIVTQGPADLEGVLVRDLEAFVHVPPEDQPFDAESIFSGGTQRSASPSRWIQGLARIDNQSVSQLLANIESQ